MRGRIGRALAWGLIWAVLGSLALDLLAPDPWPIQGSRAVDLRASLVELDRGGPALLGYRPGTHQAYPIGTSDDQGIYVIAPVLSHWLGEHDPIALLRWLWIGAWALTLMLSALVALLLFKSSWAALIAPPTLLVCILSFGFGDIYWVAAWVLVTCMPPLLLLARGTLARRWPALLLIALTAGVCSATRSQSGLAVALSAAAVAVIACGRPPARVALVLAVALAYLAPTLIALPAIREHRDQRIGVNLSLHEPTSHPLWHSLYIGLGYTRNRFGIHYLDGYAAAAAQEADPGVRYLSPAYANVLHRQVDAIVGHDPAFVARVELEKALVELAHAGRYLLLLALLLPAALTARGAASLRRGELALFAPALLIGALPAIIAIPIRVYELGLLATLGTLGLLAIGSAAARAQDAWIATRRPAEGRLGRARLALGAFLETAPRRATALALIVAVVPIATAFVLARHLEGEHRRWDLSERNPPKVVLVAAAQNPSAPRR
jgi:hypothetical protein